MKRTTEAHLYTNAHRRSIRPGGITLRQWLWAAMIAAALGIGAGSPVLWQ